MSELLKTPESAEAELEAVSVPRDGDGYHVRLEIFEGPLDLLLFLIRKKKIEIQDIPIASITADYLEYLDKKEQINLDREAEFLFIAALLIYIKSQMLLPRETDLAESEDPRRALVDRLVEYQRIKAACSLLRDCEAEEIVTWKRDFLPPLEARDDLDSLEVSLFDLAETFFRVMKRNAAQTARVIKGRDVTVEAKMKELLALLRERQAIDFLEYFESQTSLEEALISFFCVLEMVKSRLVLARQDELFHTIRIWLRKEAHGSGRHEHE